MKKPVDNIEGLRTVILDRDADVRKLRADDKISDSFRRQLDAPPTRRLRPLQLPSPVSADDAVVVMHRLPGD